TRLVAVGLGVEVPQGQGLLRGHSTLMPESLGGLVVDAFSELVEDDPHEFPRMEPRIQRFETGNLLHHCHRDSGRLRFWNNRDIVQEQAEHTLLLEAPPEL